jgi:hypothetical protein
MNFGCHKHVFKKKNIYMGRAIDQIELNKLTLF